ncbi:unnamed protein product, partial [Chrysoparadoxa australica]
ADYSDSESYSHSTSESTDHSESSDANYSRGHSVHKSAGSRKYVNHRAIGGYTEPRGAGVTNVGDTELRGAGDSRDYTGDYTEQRGIEEWNGSRVNEQEQEQHHQHDRWNGGG